MISRLPFMLLKLLSLKLPIFNTSSGIISMFLVSLVAKYIVCLQGVSRSLTVNPISLSLAALFIDNVSFCLFTFLTSIVSFSVMYRFLTSTFPSLIAKIKSFSAYDGTLPSEDISPYLNALSPGLVFPSLSLYVKSLTYMQ